MGQYHLVVNLDKREFLNPHELGAGLKLWEQFANHPGTCAALIPLLAVSNGRGGGDFKEDPDVVGRWGGDRIAIVGDYAERDDLPPEFEADTIYYLCTHEGDIPTPNEVMAERKEAEEKGRDNAWANTWYRYYAGEVTLYRDITPVVAAFIERELGGKFYGGGWRNFQTDYIEFSLSEADAYNLLRVAKTDLPNIANDLAFTLNYRQRFRTSKV